MAVHRLLFGATEPIASPVAETRSLSQNLHSFFIDKVEKLSSDIIKLLASHQRQANPLDSPCLNFKNFLTAFHPITEECLRKVILASPRKSSQANCIPTWFLIKFMNFRS